CDRSKLFSSLPQLRILKVANNSVSVVEPGVLSGLNKLIQLDLSHNQIRQLPVAVFADLKVLETLNLRGNRLQTLDNRAFEGLTKLQQVTLGDNPWNCSCAFLKMMKTIKSSLPKENVVSVFVSKTDTTLSCKSPPERTGKSPGNSWKFLLGVVVIALSTSVLIVCAVKSPSWYKLLFNYRHQRLQEEDEHNIFTRLDIHELDNEDGFIEDRYIEPGDYKDQGDS
uniref:Leucine-rich repeat-containing protein 19 n=1 Tax=Denticeps clupeoides TaxID=299321 RepID=A0AAY4A3E6_9TELE